MSSSTDKTRQQLVDSIRKTKAAAAGKTTAVNKKSPQPVSRTAKTTKKAAATTAGKRPLKLRGDPGREIRDPYRVGRRVWPD